MVIRHVPWLLTTALVLTLCASSAADETFVTDPPVPPRLIDGPAPQLTLEQNRLRISGVVLLRIGIDRTGRVVGGRVLKPLPFGLTDRAIAAVRNWRYEPARDRFGRPIACFYTAAVNFHAAAVPAQ